MKGILTAAMVAAAFAATPADSLEGMGNVKLKGFLGEKLDKMVMNHVIEKDIDYITAPFQEKTERHGWWQTEFWGKYMHSAVPYIAYSGSEKLRLAVAKGVEDIIGSQEECGYIGNYPDELRCGEGWDVWGMKYTLMGLMHYYDLTKDAKVIDSARRLCDYVIDQLGPEGKRGYHLYKSGYWCGFASSSILEPVMWLYNRTKDQKYLDFATYLVKDMSEAEDGPRLVDLALKGLSVADRNGPGNEKLLRNDRGGYVMKYNRWKAYEMMSCYQGLLEYYEVTGRKDLLDAAVATGNDIVKTEINLAGGCACSEAWFHGAEKQHLAYLRLQETCVTTTWMRFCEKLLSITGDPKWADQIERSFYNVYLGAMTPDGREFAAYVPLTGYRSLGHHHCYMHTDCCNANGPRGFLCFLKKFFVVDDTAATFNFYSSALASGTMPKTGKKVAFDMYSLYPRLNTARIVSHTEGKVPLRLRIPAWSKETVVKVNDKELSGAKAGSYFTIDREWQLGDVIEVFFDMPVIAHRNGKYVAFTRGPILLARDSRFNDGDLSESLRTDWFTDCPIRDGMRMPKFEPVVTPLNSMWMAFSAKLDLGAHHENPEHRLGETVFFCDYASAGSDWTRGNYYRTWFEGERDVKE